MSVSVKVDGQQDVVAAFREVPDAIRAVLGDLIETTAAIVESEAKGRVAVDSGELFRSIETEISPRRMFAKVGSKLYYGRFVEFGTLRMAAQPYLYPAYRTGIRYFRANLKDWSGEVGARASGRVRRNRRLRRPRT